MKKIATIKLYKALLITDIDAQTYKRVDGVLSGESDQLRNALSSDSEETLDQTILCRHLESRDSKLRSKLTFCLADQDDGDLSASNEIDQSESFNYSLEVPDKFDKQRCKMLAQRMHDYLLQGTLYDWYATQNMKGNVGSAELEEMESSIVSMLRSSYVKRPIQPFGPRN